MAVIRAAILGIIVVSFLASFLVYPQLPDQLPSHWNVRGEVDSTLPKLWGVLIVPLLSVLMFLIFTAIPRVDPLKKNINKFQGPFQGFIAVIFAFLLYIHLLILAWGIGFRFDMGQAIAPGIGMLFFAIGTLLPRTKRNWFIGIRTPWTLSSDRVWNSTHKKGGVIFKLAGMIAVLSFLIGNQALWISIAALLVGVGYLFVYSYLEFKKK